MYRLLAVSACLMPLGFAPAPMPARADRESEALLSRFERDVQEVVPPERQGAIAARRKLLLVRLARRVRDLRGRGMTEEADAVCDRMVLLESIDGGRPLGRTTVAALMDRASASGKFRHLLRVLHVPADRGSCGEYQVYGHWTGTSYGGVNDLQPGYWVYVHPRWFLWAEQVK